LEASSPPTIDAWQNPTESEPHKPANSRDLLDNRGKTAANCIDIAQSRSGAGTAEVASMARKVLVLHGPNLNLLGRREPEKYGSTTLDEINGGLVEQGRRSGAVVETFQSNSEAEIVGRIQQVMDAPVNFVIINPAAFTHTSVAIRDALAAVRVPFMEVHISNVFAREPFRHHSYFTDLAVGMICGLGPRGYELALEYALGRP